MLDFNVIIRINFFLHYLQTLAEILSFLICELLLRL